VTRQDESTLAHDGIYSLLTIWPLAEVPAHTREPVGPKRRGSWMGATGI